METYMGLVTPFAFPWAPQYFGQCNGTLLSIGQYQALYALLGTYFGGDGRNNFALPDLRSRMAVGQGQGTGLTAWNIGNMAGAEKATVALSAANLPPHSHTLAASNTAQESLTQAPASGWTLGAASSVTTDRAPAVVPVKMYNATPLTPQNAVQSAPTSSTGSGAAIQISTVPPALALNFCICMIGIFPSRN